MPQIRERVEKINRKSDFKKRSQKFTISDNDDHHYQTPPRGEQMMLDDEVVVWKPI